LIGSGANQIIAGEVDPSAGGTSVFLHPREASKFPIRAYVKVRVPGLSAAQSRKQHAIANLGMKPRE
jgi:hypothetical protein